MMQRLAVGAAALVDKIELFQAEARAGRGGQAPAAADAPCPPRR